jgi:DNA invertase Pin-like site-specific DNA recombinase
MAAKRSRAGNPKIAIAYVRVSCDDQRLGPDAQRSAIEAWARQAGVDVVAWHADLGVSGGSDLDARPALAAAIGELRARRAGVLVVAKRDRLARDVAVAAAVERAAEASGAKIVSADGAGNGDGPADAFMRAVIDAAAAYERGLIRARTRAALRAKRDRGMRAGNVPFGFVAAPDGTLTTHAPEQRVIDRVRELRTAGRTLRAIVAECAADGIASRAGTPLGLTQIARMLGTPARAA